MDDRKGRFGLYDLDGTVHWGSMRSGGESRLDWKGAHFYRVIFGGGDFRVEAEGGSLRLSHPLEIPVLDGWIKISSLEKCMSKAKRVFPIGLFLMLTACVTINIYFPAAAAERAADKAIDGVWDQEPGSGEASPPPEPSSGMIPDGGGKILSGVMDFLVPVAHAEAVDVNVSTPAINKIKESMRTRHGRLAAYYPRKSS